MKGRFWKEWFPSREIDNGLEAAESLRAACEHLLCARFQSSDQVLDTKKKTAYGASVASVLGYYGHTNAHLEVLKAATRMEVSRLDGMPSWAGTYSLRPLPSPAIWRDGESLIVASLALPEKNIWELRYGYHPDSRYVDPATGSVSPQPELHANTYGSLALSSDVSRTSLLRFWFSRSRLQSDEVLRLLSRDPLVLIHAKPVGETREQNFRSLHFSIDVGEMIEDVVHEDESETAAREAQILRSHVSSHLQVVELCRVRAADETWYVYSGAQSQFARKPAVSMFGLPQTLVATALR